MKFLKTTIILAFVVGISLLMGIIYIFIEMDIINEEEASYLGVEANLKSIDDEKVQLTDMGEYKVISEELDEILTSIGCQGKNECLTYSVKYAHAIMNNNDSYHLIGSDNKKLLLQVAASEIDAGRPVIPRVVAGKVIKKNGLEMRSRHFVTIVRNKKKCR